MNFDMDYLLSNKLKGTDSIEVVFKKKVQTANYENEDIELKEVINLEDTASEIDKLVITEITLSRLEYSAYVDLLCRGRISQEEFVTCKNKLDGKLATVKDKYESLTHQSFNTFCSKYLNMN